MTRDPSLELWRVLQKVRRVFGNVRERVCNPQKFGGTEAICKYVKKRHCELWELCRDWELYVNGEWLRFVSLSHDKIQGVLSCSLCFADLRNSDSLRCFSLGDKEVEVISVRPNGGGNNQRLRDGANIYLFWSEGEMPEGLLRIRGKERVQVPGPFKTLSGIYRGTRILEDGALTHLIQRGAVVYVVPHEMFQRGWQH